MDCFYCERAFPADCALSGNLVSNDGFLHVRRRMGSNVLIYVLEGTLYIAGNGVRREVKEGQLLLLPGGEEHYGYQSSEGRLSYFWIHFDTNEKLQRMGERHLPEKPGEDACILPEYGNACNRERVSLLFRQVTQYSRREDLYSGRILNSALELLLMELTQEFLEAAFGRKDGISPSMYRVMEWVRNNCSRSLNREMIAETFQYNPDYLSMHFKKETGMGLMSYLNRERISRSKALLSCGNISILEAAYESGFQDEKYFMRTFKRLEGITPSQYKNTFYQHYIN